MKILVITQKVDKNDPVLGFFYQWIQEFSLNFEEVKVLCLEKGEYDFSKNIEVSSLGKEDGKLKLKYILNFYKYIFKERKEYEVVFVHMNQEYVLLGGFFWKLIGKKIFLWRNHPKGNWLTEIAVFLVNNVFCTSKFSYTAKFKKTEIMPVGIDVEKYENSFEINRKKENGDIFKILYLGRIAPVKKIESILKIMEILKKEKINFNLDVIGDEKEKNKKYLDDLKNFVIEKSLEKEIKFKPGVFGLRAVKSYEGYDLFINTTEKGSMDKTIFEAMASGVLVLTSNESLLEFFGEKYVNLLTFKEGNEEEGALKIKGLIKIKKEEKNNILDYFREKIKKEHSLKELFRRLLRILMKEKNNETFNNNTDL